ncbi:MAG TPA: patatin-like phospholipase family protein [Thermoanaerobaculia bacterium]|nr:patatin-like phospholipase family protein [Thermoanaerobaculia bacterium]
MTNGEQVSRAGHPVRKRILYFAPSRAHSDSLFGVLGSVPGAARARENGGTAFRLDDITLRFVLRQDVVEAHEALHHGYYNAVVLDLRTMSGRSTRLEEHFEKTMRLLDLMDAEPDIELRYGFHRILALISGHDSAQVDDLIRRLGSRGIGHVLRDPSVCYLDSSCSRLPAPADFGQLVVDELVRMTTAGKKGSRALCASGGGITGIYFEMGALKCLSDCLPHGALNAFDMYFGISAGAVLSGILANGYSIDEFMAAIAGHPCERIPNVDLSLLKVAHVSLASLAAPFENAFRGFATTLADVVRGKANPSFSSLFLDYSDLLAAPFRADGYEAMLRFLFTQPGATNDFRKLHRRLYVGATDQDAREHVLFGEPGFDNVPVSQAIQASLSINPAFASTKIGERYYVDGAVTRTSDFTEAIRKGADLIFVLDPLVPYVSKGAAGFASRRGVLYNADQDIRTVSFTRFETTRHWVLRQRPDVSMYTFLPANRLRKVLSVNPMDHRPYLAIWRGAYLSTLQRIHLLRHRMCGDLATHGLALDTSRAEAVAARLEAAPSVTFADFFPDGKVEVAPGMKPSKALRLAARTPDEEVVCHYGEGKTAVA